MTGARSCEGTEAAFVPALGGATASVAAIADEDAAARMARLGSCEDRSCRQASVLDPAHGHHRRADQAVPVVQVERQRDVLPMMPQEVAGELCH